MDKRIARQLLKTRKIVKKKYDSLKSTPPTTAPIFPLANIYEPITKPLQELVAEIKSVKLEPKVEVKGEVKGETTLGTPSKRTPITSPKAIKHERRSVAFLPDDEIFETLPKEKDGEQGEEEEDEILADSSGDYLGTTLREDLGSFLEIYGDDYLKDLDDPLPKIYVKEMLNDEVVALDETFDHNFGVRHDFDTAKFSIGNAELDFKGADFLLKLKNGVQLQYEGTPGLYELMFKKHPIGFKPKDVENYIDIGNRSNLFRRNYSEDEQINGNSSHKYLEIIEPYLRKVGKLQPKKKQLYKRELAGLHYKGHGVSMEMSEKPIDYVHWNDPNELVARMKLLVASQAAGHTGHRNEIMSIIEELREANIIK